MTLQAALVKDVIVPHIRIYQMWVNADMASHRWRNKIRCNVKVDGIMD